jgi:hypothetical protein
MTCDDWWLDRHDDQAAAERADNAEAEWERHERDLDEQAEHLPLPLPQMSPMAALGERWGMSPRDPDLPSLDEAA